GPGRRGIDRHRRHSYGVVHVLLPAPRVARDPRPVRPPRLILREAQMATANPDFTDTPELKRRDWSIIGLIGLVHGTSHFFQLVLPTLYLSLAHEYGYDFVKLGFLASVFFLVSCLGQASSGFVVDRIGPAPVLRFGLSCFVASAVLIGVSNGYFMLVAAATIGGIGNSVFHPVDYSIINHRVSQKRLGHAFSTHGLTGNLGWALTPVF